MKALIIEPTEFTPKVLFDPAKNKFEISGDSRPENSEKFYQPILEWLDQYYSYRYWKDDMFGAASPDPVFEFKFEYFNSTSSKFILDILKKIELFHEDKSGFKVKWYYSVRWYYDEPDLDMRESGEELAAMTTVPFEFIVIIESLMLDATDFTPKVVLDHQKNKLEISGESRPDDAGKFYRPILTWLDHYYSYRYEQGGDFDNRPSEDFFEFKFDYFDSLSAKYILDILKKLEKHYEKNQEFKIKWYIKAQRHYDQLDLDIKESGEEFAEMTNVPFEFIRLNK